MRFPLPTPRLPCSAGGGHVLAVRKGMRAAPMVRCTVTGVTAIVSVSRVLGVPVHNQLLFLWALGTVWVRTLFEVDR